MTRFVIFLTFATLLPSVASAQVQVVEEEQAEEQIVERGEVRQGRGTQLGLYLVSPIYPTDLRRSDNPTTGAPSAETLPVVHPGLGAGVRGGWEFPFGLALEILLEGGIHYVNHEEDMPSKALLQLGLGGSARYLFFNPSAFVPFVQASLIGRGLGFQWSDAFGPDGWTIEIGGGFGAQIELSATFGIELGILATALLPFSYFAETALALYPFAGVTIYTDGDDD